MTAILFLLSIPATPYCQSMTTFMGDFTRTTEAEHKKETVSGKIYFDGVIRTLIISHPLNQWMKLYENSILLYYPDTRRAIRLNSDTEASLGFFTAFTSVMKQDYGLSDMGCVMERSETRSDTLITVWLPPAETRKYLGEHILAYADDRIVYATVKNAGGAVISHTTFENFFQYGTTRFPLTIKTHYPSQSPDTYEKIEYANPVFNQPLPDNIIDFSVPDDVRIEERKW